MPELTFTCLLNPLRIKVLKNGFKEEMVLKSSGAYHTKQSCILALLGEKDSLLPQLHFQMQHVPSNRDCPASLHLEPFLSWFIAPLKILLLNPSLAPCCNSPTLSIPPSPPPLRF